MEAATADAVVGPQGVFIDRPRAGAGALDGGLFLLVVPPRDMVRRPATDAVVLPDGEHHATLDAVEWLVHREGAQLRPVRLDARGAIPVDAFSAPLDGAARPGHFDGVATVQIVPSGACTTPP